MDSWIRSCFVTPEHGPLCSQPSAVSLASPRQHGNNGKLSKLCLETRSVDPLDTAYLWEFVWVSDTCWVDRELKCRRDTVCCLIDALLLRCCHRHGYCCCPFERGAWMVLIFADGRSACVCARACVCVLMWHVSFGCPEIDETDGDCLTMAMTLLKGAS